MSIDTPALKVELEQAVSAALTRMAMSNRGTLPPFRLPGIARSVVGEILAVINGAATIEPHKLGQSLGQQGVGLPAAHEAQAVVMEILARLDTLDQRSTIITNVSRFFGTLVQGLVEAQHLEFERQHADIERAFHRAIDEQREQQEVLRGTILELSTPIIPVYEGVLVLPLVGSIDSRRADAITEQMLEAIASYQAELVIMDVTGVPVIDTGTANHLLLAARAAGLLGSRVILVGIGADIAQTIVHLGIELRNLVTLANLQAGITYALEQMGMSIQPLNGRAV